MVLLEEGGCSFFGAVVMRASMLCRGAGCGPGDCGSSDCDASKARDRTPLSGVLLRMTTVPLMSSCAAGPVPVCGTAWVA